MLDLLFVFTGLVFFVVAILYVYGCEWLIKDEVTTSSTQVETMPRSKVAKRYPKITPQPNLEKKELFPLP